MPPASKGLFEPECQQVRGFGFLGDTRAETDHITVVMLARESSIAFISHDDRPDSSMAIGRDGHARTAATDEHTALSRAIDHVLGDLVGKIGIVDGLIRVRATIDNGMPFTTQPLDQGPLQVKSRVVRSYGNCRYIRSDLAQS
jgi:hypothetical protein